MDHFVTRVKHKNTKFSGLEFFLLCYFELVCKLSSNVAS